MTASETEYVLVSEYFHPDTASTGQLMTDLAVGLEERGLDMTVYTGQPHYHSGPNDREPRVSTHEGVLVKRIRAPQVRQASFLRRGFNWVLFTSWMTVVLLLSRPQRNREVIFVSTPPFLPVAMWLVCRLRGWEYTYIVYDLYPDFAVESGFFSEGGIIDRTWSWLNRHIFAGARNIVALGPVMRDRISESAGPGFDADKIAIIHNWEDPEFVSPIAKEENWFSEEHDLVDPFTLLYSGNIGGNHDLETVVRAMEAFKDEAVTLLIIGEGDYKDDIIALAEELDIRGETVRFLPYQPLDTLPHSLTAGDVSVVTVQRGLEGICVSSKLYTSLATGTPVLVIAQPKADEARILDSCEAGIHVAQGDIDGVIDAINSWRTNPDLVVEHGSNAREAFEDRFTKSQSIDEYYHLLSSE